MKIQQTAIYKAVSAATNSAKGVVSGAGKVAQQFFSSLSGVNKRVHPEENFTAITEGSVQETTKHKPSRGQGRLKNLFNLFSGSKKRVLPTLENSRIESPRSESTSSGTRSKDSETKSEVSDDLSEVRLEELPSRVPKIDLGNLQLENLTLALKGEKNIKKVGKLFLDVSRLEASSVSDLGIDVDNLYLRGSNKNSSEVVKAFLETGKCKRVKIASNLVSEKDIQGLLKEVNGRFSDRQYELGKTQANSIEITAEPTLEVLNDPEKQIAALALSKDVLGLVSELAAKRVTFSKNFLKEALTKCKNDNTYELLEVLSSAGVELSKLDNTVKEEVLEKCPVTEKETAKLMLSSKRRLPPKGPPPKGYGVKERFKPDSQQKQNKGLTPNTIL